MIEFTITGNDLWDRMERGVERVNQRLQRAVTVLQRTNVPYAIVGGHAVRAWVAQVDVAALRTTSDVDILIRPDDLPALISAMTAAGFHHRVTSGLDMFVEHPESSARDAIHVLLAGKVERAGDEPNPDVEPVVETPDFRTVQFQTLVRMKLNAFRRKDQVHLLDMISLGMVDASWLNRFPEPLRQRLQELLDDPDG
jgi:hypothetical protein